MKLEGFSGYVFLTMRAVPPITSGYFDCFRVREPTALLPNSNIVIGSHFSA